MSSEERLAREYIGALIRGLDVIRVFGADAERLTITDVAARTGLTRAGARRILLTLRHLGYVSMEGRTFSLTPRILELGYSYLASKPLWGLAGPILSELAEATGETTSAGVLDGGDLVYVLRVPSRRLLHMDLKIGRRFPAHLTSSGRMLLAHVKYHQLNAYFLAARIEPWTRHTVTEEATLRQIIKDAAAQGWCCVRGEVEETVVGLSMPVLDPGGRAIAALNISSNQDRAPPSVVEGVLLPKLQLAVRKLERSLGALS